MDSADFLYFRDFRDGDRTQYQIPRYSLLNYGVLPESLRLSIFNERILTMGLLNRLRVERPDVYDIVHRQCSLILKDFTASNVYNTIHARAVINVALHIYFDEKLHQDTLSFFANKNNKSMAFYKDMTKYFLKNIQSAPSISSTSSTALVVKPNVDVTFLTYMLSCFYK